MRTVSFQSVLFGVADQFGLDPETNLDTVQAASFTRSINQFTRSGWERFAWSDLTVTEERFYRDDYDLDTTYDVDAEVYDPDSAQYFRSLNAGNQGNLTTDTAWWEPATNLNAYILLDQPDQTPVGTVFAVYSEDPDLNPRAPRIPYKIKADRIQISGAASLFTASVWVEFRLRPSIFTHVQWDDTVAYAIGALVYRIPANGSDAECYKALQASTGDAPESNPAYWELIPMPAILGDYIQQAAYADALKIDGQNDKALLEKQDAEGLLEDAMATDSEQTGQQAGFTLNR